MRSSLGRFHRPFARVREEQLLLLNDLGDGSTLSLDFTTGVLDPRLAFTRSTTGTFIGSNGLVQSAAIDVPRFDYNPTTLAPRGLLIEGSANNLLFWSESFATSGAASNWAYNSNTGAVVTTDNPAGGTTAFQFAETANSGPLQQSATVTNVVHTFSAWFKGSVYNSVTTTQVQFGLFTTGFIAGAASIVSGPGSTSVAGNIVTLSGLSTTQWTRVQFTTSAAIPAGAVAILIYPQSTAFEVNRSFHIWGAQLETGSGASSYIPTGASQGSRAADSAVMSDIGPLNYSTTNGTLYWTGIINKQPTSFITLIGFMAATDQPTFETFGNGLSYFAAARGASLSTGGNNEAIRTYTLGTMIKYAASVDTITNPIIAVNLNGSAASTNKVGTGDLYAATRFVLGRQPVTPSHGTNYPSVTIANIKYWPTTKTATELAALTA